MRSLGFGEQTAQSRREVSFLGDREEPAGIRHKNSPVLRRPRGRAIDSSGHPRGIFALREGHSNMISFLGGEGSVTVTGTSSDQLVVVRHGAERRYGELVTDDFRVHRSVFTDPAIFDDEMTRIFGGTWIYVLHESEIPEPVDFPRRSADDDPGDGVDRRKPGMGDRSRGSYARRRHHGQRHRRDRHPRRLRALGGTDVPRAADSGEGVLGRQRAVGFPGSSGRSTQALKGVYVSEPEIELRVRSLPVQIADIVRNSISEGEIKPGLLNVSAIARRFDVSAVPVREALRLLESEGLVSFGRDRHVRVNSLSASDLREIYLMRVALESVLLKEAVPILQDDAEVTDKLSQYLETMDRTLNEGDAWTAANEAFHRTMYELVAMPRTARVVGSLWAASQPYLRVYAQEPASLRVAQAEHREMLASIEQGDAETAIRVLREHLMGTFRIVDIRLRQALSAGNGVDG
jgi:DNA-binding GntR family transcriptional regulator